MHYDPPSDRKVPPSAPRRSGRWAIALLLLAGCTSDPGTISTAGGNATTPINQVSVQAPAIATPTPLVVATPTPQPSPSPATPAPLTPVATPTAHPSASPSPTPSATASSGLGTLGAGFTNTGMPTDLAVSGPAYFVYSTKPNPAGLEDLLFSHDGHLAIARDGGTSPAVYRVRHAADSLYVAGLIGPTGSVPAEFAAANATPLTTNWAGQSVTLANLAFDADRNPDAGTTLSFDFTGLTSISGSAPRRADGTAIAAYVALAQFSDPTALTSVAGFPGVYRDTTGAGSVTLGIAVSGTGRTLGNQNLIVPRALAQGG